MTTVDLRALSGILAMRARARNSFHEFFLQFGMRRVTNPVEAPHVRFVCNRIQQFIEDPSAGVLIICLPPGGIKSQMVSQALPAWLMGRIPHCEILAAANVTALAERNGRLVREIIQQPDFSRTFNGVTISQGEASIAAFATVNGAKYRSFGVGTALYGFRGDFLLADDLVATPDEVASSTALQKILDWFEGPFLTRQKKNAKVILISQRLHVNDPAGALLRRQAQQQKDGLGRRIDSIILPMEAEYDDPMGRAPGELLWPQHWSIREIEDLKRDPFRWKTMFQQHPASEGQEWLHPDDLQFVDEEPRDLTYRTASDFAVSVNSGDYTVHLTVGTDNLRRIFVVDAWRGKVDTGTGSERLFDMVRSRNPVESLLDDDNIAKGLVPVLAGKARAENVVLNFKLMPMMGRDKETRAAPLKELFRQKKVFFLRAPWNAWLVQELVAFPNAVGQGVDDGIDALGLIGRRFRALGGTSSTPPLEPGERLPSAANSPGNFYTAGLAALFEERERGHRHFGRSGGLNGRI